MSENFNSPIEIVFCGAKPEETASERRRSITIAAIEQLRDRGALERFEIHPAVPVVTKHRAVLEVPKAERERRLDDIAEALLRACEGPNGKLKPWRPFDIHALARELFGIATAGK